MEYFLQTFIKFTLHTNKMTSLITVAALTVMPLHTFGHSETMPIKACGSALADYVASVCDGVYKSYKRTEIRPQNEDLLEPEYIYNREMFIDNDSPYPFRSKRSVSSMLKQFRSKREREVSIVHECCMKACTQDELYGYCG